MMLTPFDPLTLAKVGLELVLIVEAEKILNSQSFATITFVW